jgi:hypothetical protein
VVGTTDLVVAIGATGDPSGGFKIRARFFSDDVSTLWTAPGASQGIRFFIGATSEAWTTAIGSDDPAGSRIGLSFVNVTGARADTTFQISSKDGSSETLTNTAVSHVTDTMYDFVLDVSAGGTVRWQLNQTAIGSSSEAYGTVTDDLPAAVTDLRVIAALSTVDTNNYNVRVPHLSVTS